MFRIFAVSLVLIAANACSNQEIYELGQSNRQSECYRLQESPGHLQDCLDRVGVSYETYERQRQELLSAEVEGPVESQ